METAQSFFCQGYWKPDLIDTTMDEKTLESSAVLDVNNFSISSRPAFGRKTTQDVLKELPELPLYVTGYEAVAMS